MAGNSQRPNDVVGKSQSTRAPDLSPPSKLHHTAYVTHDVQATVAFYTKVLGLPLVSAVIDDEVPSTKDPYPYVHLFFELMDGSTVAFFESLDLPAPAPVSHPAYDIFNHLALDVGSKENVDLWAERLKDNGIEITGPTDHGIIYSIYFYDPNGIRLELTATTVPTWKDHAEKAEKDIKAWLEVKARAKREGSSKSAVEWIREHRAQHKAGLE